ncbi:hypothetical protein B0H13DRAFT_1895344 [Mycena leptocephala]|nr:hypothetical protein B0H13DRAFT_1895344 [Mycena leptocephala]
MQVIGGDIHLPFTLHVQLHRLVLSTSPRDVIKRGKEGNGAGKAAGDWKQGQRRTSIPTAPIHFHLELPILLRLPHPCTRTIGRCFPPQAYMTQSPPRRQAHPHPARASPRTPFAIHGPHPARRTSTKAVVPRGLEGGHRGLRGVWVRRAQSRRHQRRVEGRRRRPFLPVKDALRVYGLHPFSLPGVDRRSTTPAPIIPSLLEPPPGHTYARNSAFGQRPILTHRPLPHPLHPTLNPAAGPQDGRTASAPRRARTRSSAHRGVGARRDSGGRGSARQREGVIHRVVGVD